MIFETIITSVDVSGAPHVTPFGVRHEGDSIIISPFKPSRTLDNILLSKSAVMNLTDDVRVFAGALTNRQPWELRSVSEVEGFRLVDCLAYTELKLAEVRDDKKRPQLVMRKVAEKSHQAFKGFNRAQAAVIELAVLASRLHMLPKDKVEMELVYLQIAIDKTAGPRELEAWQWLTSKVDDYYKKGSSKEIQV